MQQYERAISQGEALMNKLSDPEQRKEMSAALGSTSQTTDAEIQRLQESIRKEKMEILAIEQMTAELLEEVSTRAGLYRLRSSTKYNLCSARRK